MKKWLAGLVCAGMWASVALGAQNIAAGTSVTQNFDSIGVSATATLPTDWKVDKQTTVRTLGTYAAAVSATELRAGANMSTSAGNGIYNYGAPTTAATERAVGWISSSSATKSGNLYVQMVNSVGASITNLTIAYTIEKYRDGSNTAGYQVQLYYSTDGSTWTSAGATFLTTFAADADNNGFATPPGATAAVSGALDLSATPIAASGNIYLAWNYSVQSGTTTSSAQALGVDDISISVPGEATLGVTFDQANGFNIEQGTTDVITATAASGTEPYGYTWSSSLGSSYYQTNANQFTILATAPAGSYTATVVVADAAAQGVTNSIGFNVVTPYGITITTPTNGTVTTTPASQAFAGETVTISPTADGGYRVASITVVDELSNPVTVTGNTFTMPASAVTVTVNFEVYDAPDILLDFETNSTLSTSAYTAGTTDTVNSVALTHQNFLRGNGATDWKNGGYAGRLRYQTGTNGIFYNTSAFSQPITKIDFWYANFGSDNSVTFKVQVSNNGSDWTDVGDAAYDPASTSLVEATITSIPANMTYLQFITTGGTSGNRVNIDDIGVWYGTSTFNVTFDRTNGFVVEEGSTGVITATAASGTEPYTYGWSSTLGDSYFATNANQFTILATAPVGSYSATVVATDGSAASVTNTLNFSVMAPHTITITPPVNGAVTTTPADQALAGTVITINPTPDAHYLVNQVTVTDTASNPVMVTGNLFTMPEADVIVTVTFVYHTPSALIISEVADPSNNATGGRFVELYNTSASAIDLTAGSWNLARQANGGAVANIALTGTVAAGATYVVAGSSNFVTAYPTSPVPNQTSGTIDGNGNDGYFLYSGGRNTNGILEDAYGVVGQDGTGMPWAYTDSRAVRQGTVTGGNPTWTASEWTITPAITDNMTPGVHPDGGVVPWLTYTGSTTGTVGVAMTLDFTLNGASATGWEYTLRNADRSEVVTNGSTYAFNWTPAVSGTFHLTMNALDATNGVIATTEVDLTVNSSLPPTVEISNITLALNGTGNFTFTVPTGYTLSVLGADNALASGNWAWSNLIQGVHYTVSGSNVTITTVSGSRQVIRIRLTP